MEPESTQDDRLTALDPSVPITERLAATRRLGNANHQHAFEALCALAGCSEAPDDLLCAAGESAAQVAVALGTIYETPLHDFTDPAYLAFDHTIAASR